MKTSGLTRRLPSGRACTSKQSRLVPHIEKLVYTKYHLYFQTLDFILSLFQGWNDPWLRCWLCHGPSWILPSCLNFPRYLSIYENVKLATHIMSCFKFWRCLTLRQPSVLHKLKNCQVFLLWLFWNKRSEKFNLKIEPTL